MSDKYSDKLTKNPHDPIYLVGMMGCGKSTLGKKLSESLDYTFYDTDQYIENKYHKSISSIFSFYGEKEFRKLEASALFNLKKKKSAVIATGGGLPCYYDNMAQMLDSGIVIYISMTVEELVVRLAEDENRPLLKSKNADELATYLYELLTKRESFYQRADLTIMGTDGIESQIERIRRCLTSSTQ